MINDSLNLKCSLDNLEMAREWLAQNIRQLVDDEPLIEKLKIGVNELLTNIIIHGNDSDPGKEVLIEILADCKLLEIKVFHKGKAFVCKDANLPDINTLPEGGFGLFIIESIFDSVNYSSSDDGNNVVLLTKKLR